MSKSRPDEIRGLSFASQLTEAIDADAIVSVTDPTGRIVMVNENFCEISGYSREELVGQQHRIVNSGFHDREFFYEMWKTIKEGKVWRGEVKNKRKDGAFYWVYSTIVPIQNQSGEICSFISVRHDITAKKETESQLLQAAKLAALGELSAKVAHELSNPLSVIMGLSQMLLRKPASPEIQQERIGKILKSAERMNKLVLQMKKHSRDSSDDPHQVININSLMEQSIVLMEMLLAHSQIKLNIIKDVDECSILGDAVQLESLLQNLITNSVDAFNKPHVVRNEELREITISASKSGDKIEFVYEDNAGGIPDMVQKHMFDAFFTTKEQGKGTGLGLSMIKKIVELHHGDLRFESTLGKGTRFILMFPLRSYHSPEFIIETDHKVAITNAS